MATKTDKPKFDTEAFVFQTPIEKIEAWVNQKLEELDDPDIDWPSEDETYFLGRWLTDLPYYRANNIPFTLTSARESAIMSLYDKPKKPNRRKKS